MAKRYRQAKGRQFGEATLIAGATALAYLVALAYRIGLIVRLGFPVSLATVRVSDAAIAGLIVLVGGFFAVMLADLVESWRKGLLERIWLVIMAIILFTFALLLALFLLLTILVVFSTAGWGWGSASLVLVAIAVGLAVRKGISLTSASDQQAIAPKMYAMTALFAKHPVPALAIASTVLLCLGAFVFGSTGTTLTGRSYLRTVSTNEVAIGVFEDRVILAGIEPTTSATATLTGAFRVVPLPSVETSFSSDRVRQLSPASR